MKHARSLSGLSAGFFRAARFLVVLGFIVFSTLGRAQVPDYGYVSQFGGAGSGPGQFLGPPYALNWVSYDPTNSNILVEDGGNLRIEVFSAEGTYLFQFGTGGTGPGQFEGPAGVAVDAPTHDIVVGDGDGRIQVFDSAGRYLRQFGGAGSGDGQFMGMGSVVIDPVTRNIVIADLGNHRVQVFNWYGVYLGKFGSQGSGNGQFNYGLYLNVDPNTHNILVGDEINANLQAFDANGRYLWQFGSFGSGPGQFNNCPCGLAVDASDGNIVIGDYGNSRVQVVSASGQFLSEFGGPGNGDGEFNASNGPTGLDLDQATHEVVVLDRGNSRAEIFGLSAGSTPPPPACGPTHVALSVDPNTTTLSNPVFFSAQASIGSPYAGTVSFNVDGGGAACSATVQGLFASCLHPLNIGTHTIVAQYSGDGVNPPGCSAPQEVTILSDTAGQPTSTNCSITPETPVQGQPASVVCSISASGQAADSPEGSLAPTGYVEIDNGGLVVGYVPLRFGTAVLTAAFDGGNYALTTTYSGDGANAMSAASVPITVIAPADDIFSSEFDVARP